MMSVATEGEHTDRIQPVLPGKFRGNNRPDGPKKPNYHVNAMQNFKNRPRRTSGINNVGISSKHVESNSAEINNSHHRGNLNPLIYDIKKKERLSDQNTEVLTRLWAAYRLSPSETYLIYRDSGFNEELARCSLQAKKDSSWSAVVQKGISGSVEVPVQNVFTNPVSSSVEVTQESSSTEPAISYDEMLQLLEIELDKAQEQSKQILHLKEKLENTTEKTQIEKLKDEKNKLISNRHKLENELKSIALRLVEIDENLQSLEQLTAVRVAEIARAAKAAGQSTLKREICI